MTKAITLRRSLRRSTVIIYIIALFAIIVAVRSFDEDVSRWIEFVSSILIVACIGQIDKQLPRRRWMNLSLALLFMGAVFIASGVWRFVVRQYPLDSDIWIFAVLIFLSLGYGIYGLWRWRCQILKYRDVALQRELRARRRRKTIY